MSPIERIVDVWGGWVSIDEGGSIVASGALGDRVFGWDTDDLLGRSIDQLVHSDDERRLADACELARSAAWEQVLTVRLRTGEDRWARAEVTLRSVGSGIVVADLVDRSEHYESSEGLDVLAEVRQLVYRAERLDDAWSAALSHLAEQGGFARWARWSPPTASHSLAVATPGDVATEPATRWTRWSEDTAGVDEAEVAHAVERAASTSQWGRVHEFTGQSPFETSTALLVPVVSRGDVLAVVEFTDQQRLCDDGELAMLIEVTGQLGDTIERRIVDVDLALERQRFQLAFEEAAIGMVLVNPDGTFLRANQACCDFFGRTEEELRTIGFQEITHPDDLERDEQFVAQVLAGEIDTYQMEKRYLRPDGRAVWGLLSVSLVRDEQGEPLHFISQIQDIDRQRTAQAALERTVALFAAAFDGAATGMVLVGLDGDDRSMIAASNAQFRALASELGHGRGLERFDEFSPEADTWLQHVGGSTDSTTFISERGVSGPDGDRWVRLSASPVRTSDTDRRFVIVHVEDVTEQRRAQSELAYNALHDTLTGLPNRALISERIRFAQERSDRTGAHLGILFIDLDNFKDVNDSLGHHAGDELLREVARRFANNIRPADTAARLGGDEFVILCEDLSADVDVAERELAEVARRLHRALEGGVEFEQGEGWVTASVGSEVLQGSSQSVATVLGNADVAMYRAKANGRSRTEVFDAAMRHAALERVHIASELRRAIEREQLWVAYQPIVRLIDQRVVAAEALLRWEHPELGRVPPTRFIDVAEESDLIVELGEYVVDRVCRTATALPELDYVTMNVSARQLSQSDFDALLLAAIDRHGLDPRRIAVELTENVLMDAGGSSLRQLVELRDAGLPIGVDDFGTGFASLTYLRRLPVSFVKIDKSFVDGILDDPDDRTIVHGTIGLAHSLGLALVAEGIETAEQAAVLAALGCENGQGYHFGRPTDDVDALLRR